MADTDNKDEAPKSVSLDTYKEMDRKNRDLQSQLSELQKKFEGVDLEGLKTAKDERDALKRQAAGGDDKKIDELVKARETEVRGEVGRQIENLTKQLNDLSSRNKELEVVDFTFGKAAGKFVEHAHDDLKDYIRRFGDKQDGQIVFKDDKGQVRYVNGNKPMGPDEFVAWLVETKPHWAISTQVAGVKQSGQKVVNGQAKITLQDLQVMAPAKQREVLAAMPMADRVELAKQIKI